MTVVAKTLINSKYAQNLDSSEYITPIGKKTIIDKFTATNTDAGAVTISVNIVPSDQSATGSNLIVKTKSVAAGATSDLSELQNQILSEGDFISVVASVSAKMVIRVSGREV